MKFLLNEQENQFVNGPADILTRSAAPGTGNKGRGSRNSRKTMTKEEKRYYSSYPLSYNVLHDLNPNPFFLCKNTISFHHCHFDTMLRTPASASRSTHLAWCHPWNGSILGIHSSSGEKIKITRLIEL
jgi:hypothetical protein